MRGFTAPRSRAFASPIRRRPERRFEHLGDIAEIPVTATVTYTSGQTDTVVVTVAERVVEKTIPLKGAVRSITVNDDHAALAEIEKLRES